MGILKTITNEQKIKITINPTTAAGNPAQVEEGSVKFENTTEGSDVTVEAVEGEPNSAYLVSGTNEGVANIRVSADADLGEGVATIEDNVTLTVVPATADTLGLLSGEPELK
jgi:hypothetical protein